MTEEDYRNLPAYKDLPATLTAAQIRRDLRKCTSETLRVAYQEGKIKGTPISTRRTIYHTQSVLEWLGLVPGKPGQPVLRPPRIKVAVGKKKGAKAASEESPVTQSESPQPRLPLPGKIKLKAAREKAVQTASDAEAF